MGMSGGMAGGGAARTGGGPTGIAGGAFRTMPTRPNRPRTRRQRDEDELSTEPGTSGGAGETILAGMGRGGAKKTLLGQ